MLDANDKIKLIKMTYMPQYHTFDVECMVPGKVTPEIRRFNIRNFPEHKPFKINNGMFQVSQEVRIWIKDEKELRGDGWTTLSKKSKTLTSKKHPFSIGKRKGKFLGGQSIKGFVGISEKMVPYVVIKDGDKYWRFTDDMIRFILPLTTKPNYGKPTVFKGTDGHGWTYDSGVVRGPFGTIQQRDLMDMITLLRKAEVI